MRDAGHEQAGVAAVRRDAHDADTVAADTVPGCSGVLTWSTNRDPLSPRRSRLMTDTRLSADEQEFQRPSIFR